MNLDKSNPYLSIVIAGRNDNYGGDFDARLQNSINWYSIQLENAKLPTEIVLVNYNPIPENTPLNERIKFKASSKYVTVRIITVDADRHNTYHNEQVRNKLPFYEFIAKNIGIRRAKGEYILSTNADIIIPAEIICYIAARKLKPDHFYRADRADFNGFDWNKEHNKLIEACKSNTFKLFMKGFTYDVNGQDFKRQLFKLKIYNALRLKYNLLKAAHPKLLNKYSIPFITHNAEFLYHCQGSGDFMLMHRNNWTALHGNPENTKISTHADSWIVIMAAAFGLKEYTFYSPVFHQHHERRFGWEEMNKDPFFRQEYMRFENAALKMLTEKQPIIENDAEWGHGTYNFNEQTIQ